MPKLIVSLLFLMVANAGFSQVAARQAETEMLKLQEKSYDFGKIPQGRPVTHAFEVINTGTEALKIENVQTSCGCTTPEWSKDPIAPGASTTITVGYNAAAEGPFSKSVSILYNQNKQASIIITGSVYKAPATPAPLNASISLLKQINQ